MIYKYTGAQEILPIITVRAQSINSDNTALIHADHAKVMLISDM